MPGSYLAWTDTPDELHDRFPQGSCGCGADLGGARDLGVIDRYQQHEIPQVAVTITQYDQHQVECGCGQTHTATWPDGARPGLVGYGPNLQAFAVSLLVVQFLPPTAHTRSLDQHPPAGRPPLPSGATVRPPRRDRLGGLLHEYVQVA